jgi:hypothetical protein
MPDYCRIVKIVSAFLFCIVLGACAGMTTVPPTTPTLQSPATKTPEVIVPIEITHTYLPATPERPPTFLPATPERPPTFVYSMPSLFTPTSTLDPFHTPATSLETATVPFDSQITPTETAFDLRGTQISGFSITCDESNINDTSLSPSGYWIAVSCGYTYLDPQTLEINSKEGKQWVLHFKDFLADDFIKDGGSPMGGLYPAHWTSDEKYLYFTPYIAWDGGGTCFYGFGVQGLYRINLNTGSVSAILPSRTFVGYDIAFSPGGDKLAYTAEDPPTILDLRTGEKIIVDTGDRVFGNLTWSPDGSQLAYASCHAIKIQDDNLEVDKSSIKIFSLKSHTSKTILEVKQNIIRIEQLIDNRFLEISNTNFLTNKADYFLFDWSSGQLSTATPTP